MKNILLSYGIYIILLFGVLLRFWLVSQNQIFFYYDQARDALVSRQIIENKDFKIMGPSVSGTDDSVYHGVLYYYIIAPIYTLSGGSPIVVSYILAMIGSFSIVIIYQLGIEIFSSKKIGLLAALLLSISTISIHQNTWLSNPQLGAIFIPLSYLMIWRIFFVNKNISWKSWFYLGGVIALAIQSALQSVVLGGSVLLSIIYRLQQDRNLKFIKPSYVLSSILSFLLGISSMLFTEFLMWKRGILSIDSLNLSEHSSNIISNLFRSSLRYLEIIKLIIEPTHHALLLFITILVTIVFFLKKIPLKVTIWSTIYFIGPLWLLLWHYRDPIHTFISIEIIVYLIMAFILVQLIKTNILGKIFVFLIILFFSQQQFSNLVLQKSQSSHFYGIQKGAMLSSQLKLIDQIYNDSDNKQFSISTLTSPYNINTTWAYLFDWYGMKNYGYKPYFFGPDQTGYPGDKLLVNNALKTSSIHYTIIEPDTTLSNKVVSDFFFDQEQKFGKVENSWSFGTLKLEKRISNI